MEPKQSKPIDTDKIELRPDGWERFRTAVHAAAKSGPKHRQARKPEHVEHLFIRMLEELGLLLNQPGCPGEAADGVLCFIEHLNKCFRAKFVYESAVRTGKATIVLEPSDLFLRFMSAFRARDWPLVNIIKHEMSVPSI